MEKRKLPKIKAYAVSVKTWQGATVGITGAVSRSNAISRNLFSATDAGYALKFTDFRAVRAPDFDAVVEKHGTGCWTLEYARLLQRDMPVNANVTGLAPRKDNE